MSEQPTVQTNNSQADAQPRTPTATSDGDETKLAAPSNNGSSLWKPRTPQEIAIAICAFGMIAFFFAPWTRSDEFVSGATSYRIHCNLVPWAIPLLALATFLVRRHKAVRRHLSTVTLIVTWLCVFYFVTKAQSLDITHFLWGRSATAVLGFFLFVFCREMRVATPIDLVVKRLRWRKADVFRHWGSVTPDMHFSSQEIYTKIEHAIHAKQWPGIQLTRIHYSEAGGFSYKREYLRIIRQRHLFDLCAATFGKDYFFSLREGEIPAVVTVRVLLLFLLGCFVFVNAALDIFGFILGPFLIFFLMFFAVWFCFNVLKLGMTKVDAALTQLPVIGAVYEAWFRRQTYFQEDSRLLFHQSVELLVKEIIEEETSSKGLKFLDCFEKQPLLNGLYERSRRPLGKDPVLAEAN
jgi:hypothetical protein